MTWPGGKLELRWTTPIKQADSKSEVLFSMAVAVHSSFVMLLIKFLWNLRKTWVIALFQ